MNRTRPEVVSSKKRRQDAWGIARAEVVCAAKRIRGVLWSSFLCAGLALSSCQLAVGENDLPREEWVVTSANVAWADSSHTAYALTGAFTFADPSSAAGDGYTDDYAGTKATNPATLMTISPGTIVGAPWGVFALGAAPDPGTHPVITFDINHYFYRIDNSSTLRQTVAKCHIKTASIAVTFEQ